MKNTKRLVAFGVAIYVVGAVVLALYLGGLIYTVIQKEWRIDPNWPHNVGLTTWWTYWKGYGQMPQYRKALQGSLGIAVIVLTLFPLFVLQAIFSRDRSLHGDRRFARPQEVRKHGLLGQKGLIIGKLDGDYVVLPGNTPVMLAAPSRQGKGAGFVVPNLLNYPDSAVVLDVKMENFLITSKFRAEHGQKVFLFAPFTEDHRTHRWNPMDAIRRDSNLRLVDTTLIGEMLYPRTTDDKGHWNDLARDLFIGLVLYLLETPELPCTFGEVLRQMSGKGLPLDEHIKKIMAARSTGPNVLSDACLDAFSRFSNAKDRTMSSIITTAQAPLLIFQSSYVDAATSTTDFDLGMVRKQRMTVYVGIPAPMIGPARLVVNLFFSHLINQNMFELPEQNPALKHQCLVLLDEFSLLGRMDLIPNTIGQIAGYNLRLAFIIQGRSQLIGRYGEHDAKTIEDGCEVEIMYPPQQQKDANEYSEMLGAYTAKAKSTGINTPRAWSGNMGSASENVSDQRRMLMLPQELRDLPWTSEILVKRGLNPVLCDKALYFNDATFWKRLRPLSKGMSALKGPPTEEQFKEVAFAKKELAIVVPAYNFDLHVAKTEQRIRELQTGEDVKVEALAVDMSMIRPLAKGEQPSEAEVRELTNLFLDTLPSDVHLQGNAAELPLRAPDGEPSDEEAVDLEALDRQLWERAAQAPPAIRIAQARAAAEKSEKKPRRSRKRGVIDLQALLKTPSRRGPKIEDVL